MSVSSKPFSRYLLPALVLMAAGCPQPSHAFLGKLFKKKENGPANMSSAAQTASEEAAGTGMLQQAAAYEANGDLKQALNLYRKIVKSYPVTNTAANAQFKIGVIREQYGETEKAFEAYQALIDVYKRSDRFTAAVERQFQIAEGARQGTMKTSFLGVRKKFSSSDVIKFYQAVVRNAPFSRIAPIAQFRIGEIQAAEGDSQESLLSFQKVVNDYPNSPQASEAQFRMGALAHGASQESQDRQPLVKAQDAMNMYVASNPQGQKTTEAKSILSDLKEAEAQRAFNIARFYDRQNNGRAAVIYYNEVLKHPGTTPYAQAQERMAVLARANPDAFKQSPVDRSVLAKTGVAAQKNVRGRPDYVGPPAPSLAELQAAMARPDLLGSVPGQIPGRSSQRVEVVPLRPIAEPDLPELRPPTDQELGASALMPLPGTNVDGSNGLLEPLPETIAPEIIPAPMDAPAPQDAAPAPDVPADAPSVPDAPAEAPAAPEEASESTN